MLRQKLRDSCKGVPGVTDNVDSLTTAQLCNIYVVESHRVLYCKVPKVGSTMWKSVILVLAGVFN